jgi:hypothetical protein
MSPDEVKAETQDKAGKARSGAAKRLKKEMKKARTQRDAILEVPAAERDRKALKEARKQIRALKRKMRKLAKAS